MVMGKPATLDEELPRGISSKSRASFTLIGCEITERRSIRRLLRLKDLFLQCSDGLGKVFEALLREDAARRVLGEAPPQSMRPIWLSAALRNSPTIGAPRTAEGCPPDVRMRVAPVCTMSFNALFK